ncbi:hypothetical protein BUALT_Bualt04G0016300 [Buddleja alternifolia]|uniref:F-box domain-containing protein n=1 Tax=Buddleja alternifolia TaxID=168488 RepID=A0AAV6XWE8_9LAMI|nr:hypothetical protein BUALT_Bualt04G0016300 [Buddleja alternifolia]
MIKMKRQCTMRRTLKQHKYEEGRISELPEPILHHILSFLPTKDATKTSTLSKSWNSTWKSFPILNFSLSDFLLSAICKNKNPKNLKKVVVQEFIKFVDDSINRRSVDTSIQKFDLQVDSKGFRVTTDDKNIKRWLDYAINNNVQHLVLAYHYDGCRRYILPPSLFGAKSLKNLELFGCQFIESGSIGFCLRKLSLVHVSIDQNTLQSVVSNSCCLLEELTMEHCKGFDVIKLSGLSKLDKAKLYLARDEVQIVAIEAPNLRCISYAGGFDSVRSSIVGSRYEKIKELVLHDTWITDDEFFRSVISSSDDHRFCLLEKMELKRCNLFGSSIRICSNIRLLDLSISDCF